MPSGVYVRTPNMQTGKNKPIYTEQWRKNISNSVKKSWEFRRIKYPIKNNEWKKQYQKKYGKFYRLNYPEKVKFHRKKYKYLRKNAGELTLQTIQLVYEDNIKKYGTLTCYLCDKPIIFGKDNLEHKIPISRGGTNEYNNLAIACQHCNSKKHNKTEEEYRKVVI